MLVTLYPTYAPSMYSAPCERFITSRRPKIKARPLETIVNSDASASAFISWLMTSITTPFVSSTDVSFSWPLAAAYAYAATCTSPVN
ncbi:hypothetical protein D3C87_1572120 [compost metagenome]